jgi:hypothetical protein
MHLALLDRLDSSIANINQAASATGVDAAADAVALATVAVVVVDVAVVVTAVDVVVDAVELLAQRAVPRLSSYVPIDQTVAQETHC